MIKAFSGVAYFLYFSTASLTEISPASLIILAPVFWITSLALGPKLPPVITKLAFCEATSWAACKFFS